MSMGMNCKKCGALLAPADEVCLQCGEKVDAGESARRWLRRAEDLRLAGSAEEAIQAYHKALKAPLPPDEAGPAWQKLGQLLEKQDQVRPQPGRLAEAGEAYSHARDLDPGNETLHQLWIANLSNQGSPEPALAYYKKRLAEDPADALAARMLQVARLSLEFKLNPVKVPARAPEKHGILAGMIHKFIEPSAYTFGLAVTSFLISLVLLVWGFFIPGASSAPVPAVEAVPGMQATDGGSSMLLFSMLFNPMSNFISCLVWGGYFAYLWKARKK
jgi:tetratricopeptide (TPR) repeat protein